MNSFILKYFTFPCFCSCSLFSWNDRVFHDNSCKLSHVLQNTVRVTFSLWLFLALSSCHRFSALRLINCFLLCVFKALITGCGCDLFTCLWVSRASSSPWFLYWLALSLSHKTCSISRYWVWSIGLFLSCSLVHPGCHRQMLTHKRPLTF